MVTQNSLMEQLTQDALDIAIAETAQEAKVESLIGPEATPRGFSTAKEARARVALAPLTDARVGCIVWWSASDIAANRIALHSALIDAEQRAPCPTCGAMSGAKCYDATTATTVPTHAERCTQLADLVRLTPTETTTAMRRAMGRCQSGLADGLRWFDATDKHGNLSVILAERRNGLLPGDVIASARWSVTVDGTTGALTLPPTAALLQDEKPALNSLLTRFKTERDYMTAPDVSKALVTLFLERLGGFRVKRGGAIYFVPAPGDAVLDLIDDAFTAAGVSLKRVEVAKEAGAMLGDEATDSLEEEAARVLDAARAAVAKLHVSMADAKGKGKPQLRATMARLDEVDRIRKQAKAYAAMLGALTGNVEAALKETEDATREVLSELTGGIV